MWSDVERLFDFSAVYQLEEKKISIFLMTYRNYILFRMKSSKTINHSGKYFMRARTEKVLRANNNELCVCVCVGACVFAYIMYKSFHSSFTLLSLLMYGNLQGCNFLPNSSSYHLKETLRFCFCCKQKKKKVLVSRFTLFPQKLGILQYIRKWLIWYNVEGGRSEGNECKSSAVSLARHCSSFIYYIAESFSRLLSFSKAGDGNIESFHDDFTQLKVYSSLLKVYS